MTSITIIAVGSCAHHSPYYAMMAEYKKRLPWPITLREVVTPAFKQANQRTQAEAAAILKHIAPSDHVIGLDEKGTALSSMNFAKILSNALNPVTFVIGGSDGLDDSVKARAQQLIAFGGLTWPHMLVRVMLYEQCYRAYTIATRHPYHRA